MTPDFIGSDGTRYFSEKKAKKMCKRFDTLLHDHYGTRIFDGDRFEMDALSTTFTGVVYYSEGAFMVEYNDGDTDYLSEVYMKLRIKRK